MVQNGYTVDAGVRGMVNKERIQKGVVYPRQRVVGMKRMYILYPQDVLVSRCLLGEGF